MKIQMRPIHRFVAHRFVFPPEIDFDDALDVLSHHGYSLHNMEYGAEDLFIRTYKKGATVVDVITDEAIDISYITFFKLNKASSKIVEEMGAIVEEMGAIDNKATLLFAQEVADFRAPYYVIMSSNKGFNEDIFNFIKERLSQANPQIRHHAMTSLVYLVGFDWKDKIQQLLEDVLRRETVEENRIAAQEVMQALDKNDWNEREL